MNVASIRKFLIAVGAAIGLAVSGLADGALDSTETIEIVLGFLAAYGIWRVPNVPAAKRDAKGRFVGDKGQTGFVWVLVIIALILIILALVGVDVRVD